MTTYSKIEPGDTVKVFPSEDAGRAYYGVVKYAPCATGDAWIIESDDGTITYQQTYNRIVRLQKGE